MAIEIPKILMGVENPNGWKLESILEQLFNEVCEKSEKIFDSKHPQSDMILNNNREIGQLLQKAIDVQKETYRQLKGRLNLDCNDNGRGYET